MKCFQFILSFSAVLVILPETCRSFHVISSQTSSSLQRSTTNDSIPRHFASSSDDTDTDHHPSVICVGETLYDSLPDAIFLGGATTNVGVHLASMGTPAAVVTCLGNDQLGREAKRRLDTKGVNTGYLQIHSTLNTGMVTAVIDEKGDASYTFDTPAAWDGIALSEELQNTILNAKVTVIGTLASRLGADQGATSAATILALRNLASEDSVVMDVNLRPPWYDTESVLALSRGGGGGSDDKNPSKPLALVKLNEEELPIVEKWCGLNTDENKVDDLAGDGLKSRMVALGESLNSRRVCVTRGADGAALWCGDGEIFVENDGYSNCDAEPGFDTVGAGDSFLAALIRSLFLEKESTEKALDRACALGGYVAKCRGAVPDHGKAPEDLRRIFSF